MRTEAPTLKQTGVVTSSLDVRARRDEATQYRAALMTKRRSEVEAASLWDAAVKRRRSSGSAAALCGDEAHWDTGMAAAAEAARSMLHGGAPPSLLLAVLGSRCRRKRPYNTHYNGNDMNDDPPAEVHGDEAPPRAQRRKTSCRCSQHAAADNCWTTFFD